MLNKQINKIARLMEESKLDLLLLGPSSDLQYLTGLHPLVDERFKGLFILPDKSCFYIAPELYYEETREILGEDIDIIKWGDHEGFLAAISKVEKKYGLSGKTIGVNDGIRAVDIIDISGVVDVKFSNGIHVMEDIKVIKAQEERENLRKAARIADSVMDEITSFIRPGIKEKDIKVKIEEIMFKNGGQELAFETIVASGPNSSKPHYNNDSRVIEKGDVIIMDYGCKYNNYCSDISRTVFVGEPTEEMKKVYSIVLEANAKGENRAAQGVTAEDVDRAARNVINEAGYGEYFINRTGHGVGTAVHEAPFIKEGNKQVLKDGMAFSVEPGIYIPGKFGMRVEDIVLINEGKGEVMNKAPREMIIIK